MTNNFMDNRGTAITDLSQTKPLSHEVLLDRWVIDSIEIQPFSNTRLSGEDSLYRAYTDHCAARQLPALPLRTFTRRFEIILEFHFHIASTKARDFRGTFFRGVKLRNLEGGNNPTPNGGPPLALAASSSRG